MDPRCALFILMGKTDPLGPGAPPADDGARPPRHPGRHRGPRLSRARPPRPAWPRRGRASTTSGCRSRTSSARRAAASRPPRPGSARAGSTTACGPSARPSARWRCWSQRAQERVAFGGPLADQGVVREQIAESRLEIEQARLLCHQASHVIDVAGQQGGPRPGRHGQGRRAPRGHPRSSTGPSRCTAAPASPTSPRWPPCTPGTARCACSTAPTRSTCARSPRPSSAAARPAAPTGRRRVTTLAVLAQEGVTDLDRPLPCQPGGGPLETGLFLDPLESAA